MLLNRFGLMNNLLSFLNTNNDSDIDTIIAKYLLANFSDIENMNIFDVSDACYTNRATVRRFCSAIGLKNFKEFKKEQLPREYYMQLPNIENYPSYLAQSIYDMSIDVNNCITKYMYSFTDKIHNANNCVFLISDIYTTCCSEFQKQMVYYGKIVRIIDSSYQDNLL